MTYRCGHKRFMLLAGLLSAISCVFAANPDPDKSQRFPNDATPRLHHFNKTRGYAPFLELMTGTSPDNPESFTLSGDCGITINMQCRAESTSPWSILLNDMRGKICRIEFQQKDIEAGGFQTPAICVTIGITSHAGESIITALNITEGIGFVGEENIISLNLERSDNCFLTLSAGNIRMKEIATVEIPDFSPLTFSFGTSKGMKLHLGELTLEERPEPWRKTDELREELLDTESIDRIIKNSHDDITGYWTLLDRNFDEGLIRLGGNYRLAIIPSSEAQGDDQYNIYYISGATINPTQWKPGELKGRISRSLTSGVWKIEWLDASHLPLYKNIEAQMEGNLMTVSFPYQNSNMRLLRN